MNVVATTELCNVPFKWSPPTNQHPTFYRPDSLLFLLPNFNSIKALKSIRRFNFEDRTAKALTASSRSRLYCFNFDCSFSIVSRSISLAFSSSSLICVSSWTRRSSRRTAFWASTWWRCSASNSPSSWRTCKPTLTDHVFTLVDQNKNKKNRKKHSESANLHRGRSYMFKTEAGNSRQLRV